MPQYVNFPSTYEKNKKIINCSDTYTHTYTYLELNILTHLSSRKKFDSICGHVFQMLAITVYLKNIISAN